MGSATIAPITELTIASQAPVADLPTTIDALQTWNDSISALRGLTLLRPPIAPSKWYRNINLLSIAYASRPRLRPD